MKQIIKKIIVLIIKYESILIIKKYKPKIIAVTGSVGKTSTKDAIFAVMSSSFFVRKSEKSFNSDIGIPLTVLGCQNAWYDPITWIKNIFKGLELLLFKSKSYPEWLVLEVGAGKPGDIKEVSKWLKPNIVVLTAFAKVPVHVEFFKDKDALIREKKYLVDALSKDGILIVNGDDEESMKIKESVKNISYVYGSGDNSILNVNEIKDYYSENGEVEGITFKVKYEDNIVPIVIKGSLGAKSIYSSLAAIAVGLSQKINIVKAGEAILNLEPSKGRMRILKGIKNTIIIDDSYNSSPVALASALHTLKNLKSSRTRGRKIAILGDMMELGKYSVEEHIKAGKLAAETCNTLLTVGIRARKIVEGALDSKMKEKNIASFDNSKELAEVVKEVIKSGDIILVKGSQSMRMEHIVKEIILESEKAKDLLVRQEREWLEKE